MSLTAAPPVIAVALSAGLATSAGPPEARPEGLAEVFARACVAEAPDFVGTGRVLERAGFRPEPGLGEGRRAWFDGRLSVMTSVKTRPARSGAARPGCFVMAEAPEGRAAIEAVTETLVPELGRRIEPACSVAPEAIRCKAQAVRDGHCLDLAYTAEGPAAARGSVDFLAVLVSRDCPVEARP